MKSKMLKMTKEEAEKAGVCDNEKEVVYIKNEKGIFSLSEFMENNEKTFFTFEPKSFDNLVLRTLTGHVVLCFNSHIDSLCLSPEDALNIGNVLIQYAEKENSNEILH